MQDSSPSDRRQYYRHPLRTPMQFQLGAGQAAHSSETQDISFSGLSFNSHIPIERGQSLLVTVGLKEKAYDLRAKVAYAVPGKNGYYRVGVAFSEMRGDFRREIIEISASIVQYQKELIQKTGYAVTEEEAADEWIRHSS